MSRLRKQEKNGSGSKSSPFWKSIFRNSDKAGHISASPGANGSQSSQGDNLLNRPWMRQPQLIIPQQPGDLDDSQWRHRNPGHYTTGSGPVHQGQYEIRSRPAFQAPGAQPNPTQHLLPQPHRLQVQGGGPTYNLPAQSHSFSNLPLRQNANSDLQPNGMWVPLGPAGLENRPRTAEQRWYQSFPPPPPYGPTRNNQFGDDQGSSDYRPPLPPRNTAMHIRNVQRPDQSPERYVQIAGNLPLPPQFIPRPQLPPRIPRMTVDTNNLTTSDIDSEPQNMYMGSAYSDSESESVSINNEYNVLKARLDVLEFDHNLSFSRHASPPPWYIKDRPELLVTDPAYLCGTCSRIDLKFLYRQQGTDRLPQPDEFIRLGPMEDMLEKGRKCGFCHFVFRILILDMGKRQLQQGFTQADLGGLLVDYLDNLEEGSSEQIYLYPIQFTSTFKIPALYLCRGEPPIPDQGIEAAIFRPNAKLGFREVHSCCKAPNTGRYVKDRDRIDVEWIKEQVELCDERSVGRPTNLRVNIRVIDVHRMCIVDLEPDARYVTLSYVWGDVKQVRLIWETEDLLKQDQGLLSFLDRIPKTIRDAITLTRNIGEDYLWVDALCIIQDDEKDQSTQIQHMGDIYQTSVLTIIAKCGKDASYGLPGVEPGTRIIWQMVGIAGKQPLCNILTEKDDTLPVWQTRAWTMQENVLAQRRLTITEDTVSFWCRHTSSTDDMHCRHKWWPAGEKHVGMLFFQSDHDAVVSKLSKKSNMDMYAYMVSDYTQRNMKRLEDAQNAMMGIFNHIAGLFKGEFIHGLPDTELDSALLWYPTGPSRRRANERTGSPLFPSWSWLGWVGHASYPWAIERRFPLSTKGDPVFWRDMYSSEYMMFQMGQFRNPSGVSSSWKRLEEDPWCWKEGDERDNSHYWNPIASYRSMSFLKHKSHRLEFRTISATFAVSGDPIRRVENYNYEHEVYYMHVVDSNGFCIGSVFVPFPESFTPEQESTFRTKGASYEFIVLSRASIHSDPDIGSNEIQEVDPNNLLQSRTSRLPITSTEFHSSLDPNDLECVHEQGLFDMRVYDPDHPYCMFNVMMIEWDNPRNVAFRVTVGRIHIAAFLGAGAVEKDISLE